MRNTIIFSLIGTFLASCGGSETNSSRPVEIPLPDQNSPVEIPLPDENSPVDPNISALLEQTEAEILVDRNDSKAWGIHASALFANEYFDLSAQAFRVALDINPEMHQARYISATAYWKLNKQEEAIATVTNFLDMNPDYDPAWRLLAEWHLDRGESQLAEDAATQAFKLNPNRMGTRFILAQSLLDLGRPDEAIKILEDVLENGNAAPWIYQVAANCYRQLGLQSKLEVALIRKGPPPNTWPDPMFQYLSNMVVGKVALTEFAVWTYETKGPIEAIPRLQKALKANPEEVNLRAMLSNALQESGKLQESVRVLSNIQGEPNLNYWKQFANVCIAITEISDDEQWILKAETFVQNALQINSEDGSAHDLAAKLAIKQNNPKQAAEHWAIAGKLHCNAEEWHLAKVSLAHAIQMNPSQTDLLVDLARSHIKLGEMENARSMVESLSQLDPSNRYLEELQRLVP